MLPPTDPLLLSAILIKISFNPGLAEDVTRLECKVDCEMRSAGRPISLATELEASHTLSVRSASEPEPETRNRDMSDRPTFPFPDMAHMY